MNSYELLKVQVKTDRIGCSKCEKPYDDTAKKSGGIEVHHIDYDRQNNESENLIILCKSCHMKEHIENDSSYTNFRKWVNAGAKAAGDAMRGKPKSEETKQKLREAATGKKASDETKRKMSAVRKGIPKPTKECPHCGFVGAVNIMGRWHFDNCKKKTA